MFFIKNKSFSKFFISRAINSFGDYAQLTAISIFLVENKMSTSVIATLISVNAITRIIVSFFLSKKIHHLNPKMILVYSDLLCGLLTLILVFFLKSKYFFVSLIVFEVIITVLTTTYRLCSDLLVKDIVPQDKMAKAISSIETSENLIPILVPLLASGAFLFVAPEIFIAINALTFFVSSFILRGISYEHEDDLKSTPLNLGLAVFKNPSVLILLLSAIFMTISSTTIQLLGMAFLENSEIANASKFLGPMQSTLFGVC